MPNSQRVSLSPRCECRDSKDYIDESDYFSINSPSSPTYFDGYSTCSSEGGDDLLYATSKYKTEPCKNFSLTGFCSYGSKCQFAHGDYEINPAQYNILYKTKKCKNFWNKGFCLYGIRCQFLHSQCQPRQTQQNLSNYLTNRKIRPTDLKTRSKLLKIVQANEDSTSTHSRFEHGCCYYGRNY